MSELGTQVGESPADGAEKTSWLSRSCGAMGLFSFLLFRLTWATLTLSFQVMVIGPNLADLRRDGNG